MLGIKHVSKRYGDKIVLDDISFQVTKGEPFSIIGRNGAGKSTIIKIILGLLKPDSGDIEVSEKITVGYLPEDRGLYPESTVFEHLKLFAKLSNVERAKINTVSEASLHRFELADYKDTKVKALSKGNAQKLQLALTFIGNPNFIILDEPLSGLDPINKNLLKKIIQEEKADSYIILSSHQMDFIDEICSEIGFLRDGKMVDSGSIAMLKRKHGQRKIIIPNNADVLRTLPTLSGVVKNMNFEIAAGDDSESRIREIMQQAPDIEYIKYQYTSIDDIYIKLLGEEGSQ